MDNGGLPMTAAERAKAGAIPQPTDDATEEAATAVSAKKTKDPYLEAIRRVRDIYAALSPKVRGRVHSIVGQLYVEDGEPAAELEATDAH